MTTRIQIRQVGNDGVPLWLVTTQEPHPRHLEEWARRASGLFDERAEVASLSIVRPIAGCPSARLYHATHATLPICFVNPRISELIGFAGQRADLESLADVMDAASLRGLTHCWLRHEEAPATMTPLSRSSALGAVGPIPSGAARRPIGLGIDASWLLGGESGAQVFATEMLRELARRPEIDRIVLLSERGGLPNALADTAKVTGTSWQEALAAGSPWLDVMHRPYQPGEDAVIDRYRRVANSVVITVLDLIAYDNAAYHETHDHWRQHREVFDRRLCEADQVVAISETVARRVQGQFAHRLAMPVCVVPLGTDHLPRAIVAGGSDIAAIVDGPFALVLGNDFAHKNRDFAVRVFAAMCERGYQGRLVLAGFHLDLGSSHGYELDSAGGAHHRINRIGPVSPAQKRALLQHADIVLYPTSSEGFGLVPFEAAMLGTPCAFVRFGALRETMPEVRAAREWSVGAFTELALELLDDPETQVRQILAASRPLTWARAADEMVAIYQRMAADETPWGAIRPVAFPRRPLAVALGRTMRRQARRVTEKLRRVMTRG